jgi:hypothetical protein
MPNSPEEFGKLLWDAGAIPEGIKGIPQNDICEFESSIPAGQFGLNGRCPTSYCCGVVSPHDNSLNLFYQFRAQVLWMLHRYDEAIEWWRRSLAINAEFPFVQLLFTAALASAGSFH